MSAIGKALLKLSPTGKWRILGEDKIENIEWEIEPENKPTDEEIQTEVVKQEKLIQDTQYQRDRAISYPSIDDVVVALAEKEEGDDTMWKEITAKRQKVKADNPKPE